MDKDDNTLLTASSEALKVWNTSSCECLETLPVGSLVRCMLKTKDKSSIVCGLSGGRVEMRRASDLGVFYSFRLHDGYDAVKSICELEDGSFVSAVKEVIDRWDSNGRVLQTFSGHAEHIYRVIELNRDVIVSASLENTVKMWKVSTGECLRTLTLHSTCVYGLEKVKDGVFVSGSMGWKNSGVE